MTDLLNCLDLLAEHFGWSLVTPEHGEVRFHQWWSRHPRDHRFMVRHDLPADAQAHRAMFEIAGVG